MSKNNFEDQKNLLITSDEWKIITANNKSITEEDITNKNIQTQIDNIARQYAFHLRFMFYSSKNELALNDGYCEILLDDGNIFYKQ